MVTRPTRKAVDSRSDGTLVGQVTRDSAFVFLASAPDECGMEDESIFGSVSFRFQGSEIENEDINTFWFVELIQTLETTCKTCEKVKV